MLSSVSLPHESLELRVVLGTSELAKMSEVRTFLRGLCSLTSKLTKLFAGGVQKRTPTKDRLRKSLRDFPGGPVVKNPPYNAGDPVQSLVRELRSHMPWGN